MTGHPSSFWILGFEGCRESMDPVDEQGPGLQNRHSRAYLNMDGNSERGGIWIVGQEEMAGGGGGDKSRRMVAIGRP